MRNTVALWDASGDPITSSVVQAYLHSPSPPYYTTGSGYPQTLTQVPGKNIWYLDVTQGAKVTILVNSTVMTELIGIWFEGEDQPFYDY